MKTRKILLVAAIAVVVLGVVLVIIKYKNSTIELDSADTGKVTYVNEYTGVSFTDTLTDKEMELVVSVLNGKTQKSLISGASSCGFSKDISVTINGVIFGLARDKCGVLLNYNDMCYVYISDEERELIESVFKSRGGEFPCI